MPIVFASAAHEHWVLFLVEGVVLVVLGATAIVIPVIATLAATIVLGWLFLVSGIMGLVTTFWMRQAPGFWWSLISAVLGIVVGALLLASPLRGAVIAHHRAGRLLHHRRRRLDHVRARS